MSIIVGFNLQTYVILGADTRISFYPDNHFVYRDDEEKIQTTGLGLITGAGLCDLLDPVKERFAQEKPSDTSLMRQIIREEGRNAAAQFAGYPDPRVEESIKTTGWMLTYVTGSEQYFPAGLRLAVMSNSFKDDTFGLVLPGTSSFLPFAGITEAQHGELKAIVTDGQLRMWKPEKETFEDNLAHHVGLIVKVIVRASKMSEMVSPMFQVGLHSLANEIGISKILDPARSTSFELTWTRPATEIRR